jgi:hypothetical protein
MAISVRLVRSYAFQIYIDGTRSFSTINSEYHPPVKEYASVNFTFTQVDDAFAKGWITQQEYDETIELIQLQEVTQ